MNLEVIRKKSIDLVCWWQKSLRNRGGQREPCIQHSWLFGWLLHQGQLSACSHVNLQGSVHCMGVFLRDPSPYLLEFQTKPRKTLNVYHNKRDWLMNLAPHICQICHWWVIYRTYTPIITDCINKYFKFKMFVFFKDVLEKLAIKT